MTSSAESTVRDYLAAVERGATGNALAAFFHPDVKQQEFHNRLVPNGATRDLQALLDAALKGQKVVESQRYEVLFVLAQGDHVAMEVNWSGVLRVPVGSIPQGGTMRGRFGVFITLKDGLIISQRNYDCIEPF